MIGHPQGAVRGGGLGGDGAGDAARACFTRRSTSTRPTRDCDLDYVPHEAREARTWTWRCATASRSGARTARWSSAAPTPPEPTSPMRRTPPVAKVFSRRRAPNLRAGLSRDTGILPVRGAGADHAFLILKHSTDRPALTARMAVSRIRRRRRRRSAGVRPKKHEKERAMDLQLKGKRALVTGSTAGIGFADRAALANEGAAVVVNGRTPGRVDDAVREVRAGRAEAADVRAWPPTWPPPGARPRCRRAAGRGRPGQQPGHLRAQAVRARSPTRTGGGSSRPTC